MMEQLPEEVFTIIVPCLDGAGFVQLRRTCWRLKTICDNIEMFKKPVLWWRYVLMDFPQPLLNMVSFETPKEDEISWKKIYISLYSARTLKYGASYLDLILETGASFYVDNLGFVDDKLIAFHKENKLLHEILYADQLADCLTVDDKDLQETEQEAELLTWDKDRSVQEHYETFIMKTEVNDLKWAQYEALCGGLREPKRLDNIWQDYLITLQYESLDKALVEISRHPGSFVMGFYLESFYEAQHIVFNDHKIVILFQDKIAIAAIDLALGFLISFTRDITDLNPVKSILLIDTLLLFVEDGSEGLQGAKVCEDSDKDHVNFSSEFSTIKKLNIEEDTMHLPIQIADMHLHNNIMFVLTESGGLSLFVLEGCELEDLDKNQLPCFKLKTLKDGTTTRMAVTSDHGLKVAVLEQTHDGVAWRSRVHMIYIRKKRELSNSPKS